MTKQKKPSDEELIKRMKALDDEWGYTRWPEIAALAEQLRDEEEKKKWNATCVRYSLYERAMAGDL